MERLLAVIISHVVPAVEACGALAILLAVARAIVRYAAFFVTRRSLPVQPLRIQLGQAMVLGLEFMARY